ncbi:hypothetical protein M9Y10_018174 [Tritrichomonas musculus]|uniref:DUF3447 domain-containing protein n=1 Tax=Tritrichomonas musculus TaxID=1915356 RepID=A0ABR2HN77_9EUKA
MKKIGDNYITYFLPEVKKIIKREKIPYPDSTQSENIENDRETESNLIHQLIQKDSIDDFVSHVTKKHISLNSTIDISIFETNNYLINQKPTLIECAAFYGSIQIFNFLRLNNIQLDQSLWLYAIHGNDPQIIHDLEKFTEKPTPELYEKCLIESIKCHHNNLANYFINNYFVNDQNIIQKVMPSILEYYNFILIQENCINKTVFYELCKFNYVLFVKYLLEESEFDFEPKSIQL